MLYVNRNGADQFANQYSLAGEDLSCLLFRVSLFK